MEKVESLAVVPGSFGWSDLGSWHTVWELGRKDAIDDVSVNPYTLNASVRGLRVFEADGATAFASFDNLDIDGSASSFYRFAPIADEVTLSGLKVNLVRDGDTHYNVSDVIGRMARNQAARSRGSGGRRGNEGGQSPETGA